MRNAILTCILLGQVEPPASLLEAVVKAAGGKEKLLSTFRFKERIAVTADLEAKGSERTSVVQYPAFWYLGKKNRVEDTKEPAVQLAWAWSLRALLEPAAKLDLHPEKDGQAGLRLSRTVDPPMDLWFDAKEKRLSAIEWRKDRHVFSEWKEIGGTHYASRVVGLRSDGKVWYHTRILELEKLDDLPPELKR
jgi:hypothetical protein